METRPFASLSASLLARKGQARPAMRPGGSLGPYPTQDDLGWDDLGPPPAGVPTPVRQQAEIARELEVAQEAPIAVPAIEELPAPAPLPAGRKAAFTLRLDRERHLRLRLACAVSHVSAQQFVTAALDAKLHLTPALDALADACPATLPARD